MSEHTELQSKLDLIEELQIRLENRQQGFGNFSNETKPTEEQEEAPGELEAVEFTSLERLTDFFGNIKACEVETFGVTQRLEFEELLGRAIKLLDDARHFDPVTDLAKRHVTDKATFIQAANEIFEEIPDELHELKQRAVERRLEQV